MQCMNDEGASLLVLSICLARGTVAAHLRENSRFLCECADLLASGSSEIMHMMTDC